LQLHGRRRGLRLAVRRILRCRPFGPSGWDPVPLPRNDDLSPIPTTTPSSTTPHILNDN
jgi:putative component of membrane protein insertase Oxa1/YidC/SpoIIIJ protein YidD